MIVRVLVILSLLGSATTASADDGEATTTSYRAQTLTVDALGLSLLVAGGFAEGDGGRDTSASDGLFTAGLLTMSFATPIIHWSRGHRGRAVGSFLLRWGAAGAGAWLAVAANSGCDDGVHSGGLIDDDFLCELDYVGYGVLGGFVVASAIDAAFMTDEEVEPATWAPQLSASRDGVRAGVAFVW